MSGKKDRSKKELRICSMEKRGLNEELRRVTEDADCTCRKCSRAANDVKYLCKPEKP